MKRTAAKRGKVPLVRALSKLGLASRSEARTLIHAGRVSVDDVVMRDPAAMIVPEAARVAIDGVGRERRARSVVLFHKPRGVVTTRHDPEGRRTVFDVLGDAGRGLIAAGRLDMASTGLLILTNDTAFANWLTDPASRVPRRYVVTVRGHLNDTNADRLRRGLEVEGRDGTRERLSILALEVRKRSSRETHVIVTLVEGRNREIRRLFAAVDHDVTRVHRVSFGEFELGDLQPGAWTEIQMSSRPNFRSHRSASRHHGQSDSTSRQKRRE
jgi:23S rRNA pseudouridine2605 synthase